MSHLIPTASPIVGVEHAAYTAPYHWLRNTDTHLPAPIPTLTGRGEGSGFTLSRTVHCPNRASIFAARSQSWPQTADLRSCGRTWLALYHHGVDHGVQCSLDTDSSTSIPTSLAHQFPKQSLILLLLLYLRRCSRHPPFRPICCSLDTPFFHFARSHFPFAVGRSHPPSNGSSHRRRTPHAAVSRAHLPAGGSTLLESGSVIRYMLLRLPRSLHLQHRPRNHRRNPIARESPRIPHGRRAR
ncbi:hypothetical protein HDK90DRAFT_165941 [Phyllosticta capitalensis]|uniref:Uncharacterized protein n=1 Tax=Phyllosticta capitalensis TaxID=121624 RepID=A0ABR1Z151_9PEZI